MLTSIYVALALLRAPPPVARPAVVSRSPAVRAVASETPTTVVGQVAGSNPTDSFGGKLYDRKKEKELPPVWGGLRVGTRKLVVVTGVRRHRARTDRLARFFFILPLSSACNYLHHSHG